MQELMLGTKQNGLLHKLGINGREINFNNEPLRFFKPTAGNIFSLGRKGNWNNHKLGHDLDLKSTIYP